MEFDVSLDTEQQFWDGKSDHPSHCVSANDPRTTGNPQDSLRLRGPYRQRPAILSGPDDQVQRCGSPRPRVPTQLTERTTDDYLRTELDVSRCLFKLFASDIFGAHADYVRKQIIYGLIQVCEDGSGNWAALTGNRKTTRTRFS